MALQQVSFQVMDEGDHFSLCPLPELGRSIP